MQHFVLFFPILPPTFRTAIIRVRNTNIEVPTLMKMFLNNSIVANNRALRLRKRGVDHRLPHSLRRIVGAEVVETVVVVEADGDVTMPLLQAVERRLGKEMKGGVGSQTPETRAGKGEEVEEKVVLERRVVRKTNQHPKRKRPTWDSLVNSRKIQTLSAEW